MKRQDRRRRGMPTLVTRRIHSEGMFLSGKKQPEVGVNKIALEATAATYRHCVDSPTTGCSRDDDDGEERNRVADYNVLMMRRSPIRFSFQKHWS